MAGIRFIMLAHVNNKFITDSCLYTFPTVQRIFEKQTFALPHTQLSLLIRAGNHWWVSSEVGEKDGFLKAKVAKEDPLVPPIKGWRYDDDGDWMSNETLECSRTVSSAVCAEVRIELVVTQ